MSWVDTLDSVMDIEEIRASESVSACYGSPGSSDKRTARQKNWLSQ